MSYSQDYDFDANLHVGQIVQIRWTNSNRHHCAKAEITAVNAKSVRARLLHPVDGAGHYPIGHVIKVPRLAGNTVNNGVFPAELYKVTDPLGVYQTQTVFAFSSVDAKMAALPLMFGCPLSEVDAKVVEENFLSLSAKRMPQPAFDRESV